MKSHSGATGETFWGEVDPDLAVHRYRTLVDAIDDGIYRLDADGHFAAVDDEFVETTGYAREDLLGEPVSLVLADEDADRLERELASRAESGDTATFELAVQTADGRTVPCEFRVNLLLEDGDFRGSVGVVRTRREQQRPAAVDPTRDLDDSLIKVLDQANVGVFVLDEEFRIAWVDETAGQYFGFDRDDLLGRDKREVVEEVILDAVDDPDRFAERVLATYDDNSYVEEFECFVTGQDGEGRWLEHRSQPIESGRFAGGRVELYYDVTDRRESSESLRETEEQFQSLVDAVEEYAIFRLDPDGNVKSWNEGARAIKGYEAEDVIGEHFSTFYTEDDREAGVPDRNLQRADEAGSAEDEGWRVREDGSRFWASVTITAIRDEDGTHRGYLKVTRDMTDRHRREMELQSELQRILERISDAFFAVDGDFRFTHVNERAEQYLGYSEEELIGGNLWDVFPDDAEITEVEESFQTAMQEQEPVNFEVHYDPQDAWIEANLYPSETGISVYFRDVTERREYQRKLEESERRYRTLVENFPQGVVALFDEDLHYRAVGGQLAEAVGVDPSDRVGEEIPSIYPDDVMEQIEPYFHEALEGESNSFEVDYHDRHLHAYTLPVRDADDEVYAGMLVVQDVTERREYERKLEESNERLEQFAYAASHDLQEPLRMVSSYLQMIERRYEDDLDEDGREFLEFAVDGADRMRDMIDGLLEYSRVESQGEPLEPVDLEGVLEAVREDLRVKIEETDAEISAEPLPRVEGDRDQLRQLFQNLLDNAIEYSGDALPRVHVTAERAGDRWEIAVRDEGIGIDPDDADRIFEVFQSLHTQDHHGGTGIGLALCQRIVERHGGTIRVDSEPGEGSTFTFALPAAGDDDE